MIVIAHRGASADYPENTMAAFDAAVEAGADMIETDLHLTRDGAIVLVHDAQLPGHGDVGHRSLREIRQLDGGDLIPSLAEVLDRFGTRIEWNLEIKRSVRGRYPGLPSAALREVEKRGLMAQTLFSCFDPETLSEIRSLAVRARLGVLQGKVPIDPISKAVSLRAEAVHPKGTLVTPELIQACHARKLQIYPYTVDEESEMRRFRDWGVDGLFTNHPARLRALLAAEPSAVEPAEPASA